MRHGGYKNVRADMHTHWGFVEQPPNANCQFSPPNEAQDHM
jgi:hypothetical protein